MPFSLHETALVSSTLKELCVGLVELAYPDSTADFKMNLRHDIKSQFSPNTAVLNMWPRLFKVMFV